MERHLGGAFPLDSTSGFFAITGQSPAARVSSPGYLVEKSLSVDNVLVFLLVFRAFGIEPRFQHRVLFWGMFGALVLRGTMIGLGAALVYRFAWILYLFGAFLLFAGARMLSFTDTLIFIPQSNSLLRWARRIFPVGLRSQRASDFFVMENGRRAVTSLFLALVVFLESVDLLLPCRGLDPRRVRHQPGIPFSGLYVEYLCHSWNARVLLPDWRSVAVLSLFGRRAFSRTDLHWGQNAGRAMDSSTHVCFACGRGLGALLGIALVASILAPRPSEPNNA